MKVTFKPLTYVIIFALSAMVAALYTTSCKLDKCKSIVCAYGGSCEDGACKCQPGYQGPNCETITRTRFNGLWTVTEKGSNTPLRKYPLNIESNGKDVTVVYIQNLYNYFTVKIKANVDGDTLIIPNQQVMGKVVFGKGYIYTEKNGQDLSAISMRYEVIDTATGLVDDFGYYYAVDSSMPSSWIK